MPARAFLTPPPIASGGVALFVPCGDLPRLALCWGALATATTPESWEQIAPGDLTPDEAASEFSDILYRSRMITLTGTLITYITATPPVGALACDGATYARVDYPALYDALDPAFRIDANSFFVPDLRDRALFGAGALLSIGQTRGAAEVTLTESQMPSHSHFYYPPTLNLDLETPGVPDVQGAGLSLGAYTSDTGGDQPHENLPPVIGVKFAVWY